MAFFFSFFFFFFGRRLERDRFHRARNQFFPMGSRRGRFAFDRRNEAFVRLARLLVVIVDLAIRFRFLFEIDRFLPVCYPVVDVRESRVADFHLIDVFGNKRLAIGTSRRFAMYVPDVGNDATLDGTFFREKRFG